MDLEKKYNDLINKVSSMIKIYYSGSISPYVYERNAVIYRNRYNYYAGMLRILKEEAQMLGITLKET